MNSILDKLFNLINAIFNGASRSSGITGAKIRLNNLEKELDNRERAVGRKFIRLKKKGVVQDKFLLEAMKEEMAALDDCQRRVEKALDEIHGFSYPDDGLIAGGKHGN